MKGRIVRRRGCFLEGSKGAFDELELDMTVMLESDADGVEAKVGRFIGIMLGEIMLSGEEDALLFLWGDGSEGVLRASMVEASHFDEDEGFVIEGDDIDFSTSSVVIEFEDLVKVLFLEPLCGDLFGMLSERAFILHHEHEFLSMGRGGRF